MNPIVMIMLIFALIGFLDKILDLHLGLSYAFDDGFSTMLTLMYAIVGIGSVGVTLIETHLNMIHAASSFLPFDPSMLIGILLAPDIGGFPICEKISSSGSLTALNGVILSSLLGQFLSFQLPVFSSALKPGEFRTATKGFIIGIIAIPVGFAAGGLLLHTSFDIFTEEFLALIIICGLAAFGLFCFTAQTLRIFGFLAKIVQILMYVLFFLAMLGVFFPAFALTDQKLVMECSLTVLKTSIVVCGSLVLSKIIMKTCRTPIRVIADRLGVNETSVVCLLLNCATSLAFLPLFSKMDTKGKLFNAAFAVSGSYVIGGQFGYVSNVAGSHVTTIFLISKLICGLFSILLMMKLYPYIEQKRELS